MADEYLHPELRNLVNDLDEEELAEIGSQVLQDYTDDLESRSEWEEMHGQWLRTCLIRSVRSSPNLRIY